MCVRDAHKVDIYFSFFVLFQSKIERYIVYFLPFTHYITFKTLILRFVFQLLSLYCPNSQQNNLTKISFGSSGNDSKQQPRKRDHFVAPEKSELRL